MAKTNAVISLTPTIFGIPLRRKKVPGLHKCGTLSPSAGNTQWVDDARLLERACRGDAEAVSRLFASHQASIYRYAVHMCGPDAGDDIVQETFLAVLRQPGRYDPSRGPVIGYLFGIARHLALKRLVTLGAAVIDDVANYEDASDGVQETVLDTLTRTETIAAVRAAVRSLPPLYREVVILCELQEMDYMEAASIIQCPVGTIRSRLHRAKSLLSVKLADLQPASTVRNGS